MREELWFSNFKALLSHERLHISAGFNVLSPEMVRRFSSSLVGPRSLHFPNLSSDFVAGRPETFTLTKTKTNTNGKFHFLVFSPCVIFFQ